MVVNFGKLLEVSVDRVWFCILQSLIINVVYTVNFLTKVIFVFLLFLGMVMRTWKKLEFQLVLWANSSHILLAPDLFLLVLVNRGLARIFSQVRTILQMPLFLIQSTNESRLFSGSWHSSVKRKIKLTDESIVKSIEPNWALKIMMFYLSYPFFFLYFTIHFWTLLIILLFFYPRLF